MIQNLATQEQITQLNSDLESKTTWHLINTVSGTSPLTIPNTYSEVMIHIKHSVSPTFDCAVYTNVINIENGIFGSTWFDQYNTYGMGGRYQINNNVFTLIEARLNLTKADIASNIKVTIYGR